VVIAIIGLLSTIVAAPVQSARKKAKDTKKVAEIKQMQTALANYANDNGQFPSASTTFSGSTLTSLSPSYMPALPSSVGTTVSNARDKTFYATVRAIPVGATTTNATSSGTKTFGYHLAATLEVFNTVLNDDDDCWGVVSTTTGGASGRKDGTACQTYVSAWSASTNNPAYFGGWATSSGPITGTAGSVLGGITSQNGVGSTTFAFDQYAWLSHPMAPSSTADIQGDGVNEVASSTCATVDMCVFDVADNY
jgi:type II secretory pathway pseudopilin PulG